MPWISITAKQNDNHYGKQGSVIEKNYDKSDLFIKYEHKSNTQTKNKTITVYEKYSSLLWTKYLTLNHQGEYLNATFLSADVYYNRYEKNIPLVIVLFFKGGTTTYQSYSFVKPLIQNSSSRRIADFYKYDREQGDKKIFELLISENDNLNDLVTLKIDKKITKGNIKYNKDKITLTKDVNAPATITSSGFMRCKHTPFGAGSLKNACVTFDNNLLLDKTGRILSELQFKKYSYVHVYWSNKVDLPLLLEVNFHATIQRKNEYYFHNISSKLFWEKLDRINFQQYTGHTFKYHQSIYQQIVETGNDKLLGLLKTLESRLVKTLVLLVNNDRFDYGEIHVKETLVNHNYRLINKSGSIVVNDIVTKEYGKCVDKTEFRVYEHDFSNVVKSIDTEEQVNLKLLKFRQEIDDLTINLDVQVQSRYYTGPFQILVSTFVDHDEDYIWCKHYADDDITNKKFHIKYKDQTAKIDGQSNVYSYNKYIYVYFHKKIRDRFYFIAFPSKKEDKIKYLTYEKFKQHIGKGEINFSNLQESNANTKIEGKSRGGGFILKADVKSLLDKEKGKAYSIRIEVENGNRQEYKSGMVTIKVSVKTNERNTHFNIVEHSFEAQTDLCDIIFVLNYDTKTLDINGQFKKGISLVSIYFHNSNNKVPLIVGLTDGIDKKYFKYAEFLFNVKDAVKLSNLESIKENEIYLKLYEEFSNLTKNIRFDVFSDQDYLNVKVSPPMPYGNYKWYIHTPTQYFKQVQLDKNDSFQLNGFRESDYSYQNLLSIIVYYHCFDKDNHYPLIISMFIKSVELKPKGRANKDGQEYVVKYGNKYYLLVDIDKSLNKIYNEEKLYSIELETKLRETYIKFLNKIDGKIGISDLESLDTLTYTKNIEAKIYFYYHKNDPRPILICFNNEAYKRYYLDKNISKWIKVSNVTSCICKSSENQDQLCTNILSTLNGISESLSLIKSKRIVKKEQETYFKIDLSKSGTSYGDQREIIVTEKKEYTDCDLFIYCTHSYKNETDFIISSITFNASNQTTITETKSINKIQSLTVYFNINAKERPILIEIIKSDKSSIYYKDLKEDNQIYPLSSLTEIKTSNLVDELIRESDKINNRLTFQIEKISPYNTIKLTPNLRPTNGFTMYSHSPIESTTKKSDVIYRNKLLSVDSTDQTPVIKIQDVKYESISVYVLDIDKSLQLLIEFKESQSAIHYFSRINSIGTFKKLDKFTNVNDQTIGNKLVELYYFLTKSLIVEIDEKGESASVYNYEVKLIDNTPVLKGRSPQITDYSRATKTKTAKNIQVKDVTSSFGSLNTSSFKCYQHNLPKLRGTSEVSSVGGLRLYIKTSANMNRTEIELYPNNFISILNRTYLYYTPKDDVEEYTDQSTNIQVFFHKYDPRPLLLFYNDHVYRRIRSDNNSQWYKYKNNKILNSELLRTLKNIYKEMEKKITLVKENGIQENIETKQNQDFDPFKKDIYISKVQISQDKINYSISKDRLNIEINRNDVLNQLFDTLYNKTYDHINVYKTSNDSSLKNILAFEFVEGSSKTHLQRKDTEAKYWVNEQINYSGDEDLKRKLETIQNTIKETIVCEIDKTQDPYSNDISLHTSQGRPKSGFTKYIHFPKGNNTKISLLLYNGKKLTKGMGNDTYQLIDNIEKHKYSSVTVYFGTRVYSESNKFPLIIELDKGIPSGSKDLYYHKRKGTNHYWEPLSNFVDDSDSKKLIQKLYEVEFDLFDCFVILMERNDTNSQYGQIDINPVIGLLDSKKVINPVKMNTNKISLRDATTDKGKCVKTFNYKIVEHSLTNAITGLNLQGKSVGIKLVIPDKSDGKYIFLTLYKGDKSDPENIDYLYYSTGQNEVYVYFYGNDPRPLLVTYNGNGYKPKSKELYFSDWHRVGNGIDCQQDGNDKLVATLTEVVRFLNDVDLDQRPGITSENNPSKIGEETATYEVQTFNNKKIEIQVSYENKLCYRVYTHKHKDSNGYRLGNIKHINTDAKGINYQIFDQLESVLLYYNVYDKNHQHLLLVELKFKGNHVEHFELDDKREKKWKKIDYKIDSDYVEKTAYNTRYRLGISYSEEQKKNGLFITEKCTEDQIDVPSVAGGTAGGLVGAGALGGGGYLLYAKIIVTATSVAPS